jgi:hypothetical protein
VSPKATAGYSGTPLPKKLGIPATGRALFVDAPEHFRKLVAPLPPGLTVIARPGADLDYIHLFTQREADLQRRLAQLVPKLAKHGAMWISWPKRSSGIATDVTEDVIRKHALKAGVVDVKVCAVDETWSALKLVYRLEDR